MVGPTGLPHSARLCGRRAVSGMLRKGSLLLPTGTGGEAHPSSVAGGLGAALVCLCKLILAQVHHTARVPVWTSTLDTVACVLASHAVPDHLQAHLQAVAEERRCAAPHDAGAAARLWICTLAGARVLRAAAALTMTGALQGSKAQLLIVAVARGREQQVQMIEGMEALETKVVQYKYGLKTSSRAFAAAYTQGQVKLAWLDAGLQAPFCRFHLQALGISSGTVCDTWPRLAARYAVDTFLNLADRAVAYATSTQGTALHVCCMCMVAVPVASSLVRRHRV